MRDEIAARIGNGNVHRLADLGSFLFSGDDDSARIGEIDGFY
jgi:hypothetical protein